MDTRHLSLYKTKEKENLVNFDISTCEKVFSVFITLKIKLCKIEGKLESEYIIIIIRKLYLFIIYARII